MESYYEVNVSVLGQHVFATAPRSLTTRDKAEDIASLIKERFPESEGYKVTMTYWECGGHSMEIK